MPLFEATTEVFEWVKAGKKTIDIRKGKAIRGEIAVFQCGNRYFRPRILKKITGRLYEIINYKNYSQVVPSAKNVDGAIDYIVKIYHTSEGYFTAYYLEI
jgi:ASC-1-like (ASCH) protein